MNTLNTDIKQSVQPSLLAVAQVNRDIDKVSSKGKKISDDTIQMIRTKLLAGETTQTIQDLVGVSSSIINQTRAKLKEEGALTGVIRQPTVKTNVSSPVKIQSANYYSSLIIKLWRDNPNNKDALLKLIVGENTKMADEHKEIMVNLYLANPANHQALVQHIMEENKE